jgi:hypothetical protein
VIAAVPVDRILGQFEALAQHSDRHTVNQAQLDDMALRMSANLALRPRLSHGPQGLPDLQKHVALVSLARCTARHARDMLM